MPHPNTIKCRNEWFSARTMLGSRRHYCCRSLDHSGPCTCICGATTNVNFNQHFLFWTVAVYQLCKDNENTGDDYSWGYIDGVIETIEIFYGLESQDA